MYLVKLIDPHFKLAIMDVKFSIQIGSEFGARQNVLKLILKSPRFVPFEANLTQFVCQIEPAWYV